MAEDLVRFFEESGARVRSLRREGRAAEADRIECGLRRLARTVRDTSAEHGLLADLLPLPTL